MPAAAGGLTVSFNEAYATGKEGEKAYAKLDAACRRQRQPLATLPRKIDDATNLIDWFWGKPEAAEAPVFLVPEFNALVLIPPDRTRIDVYRTDLDQIFKEAKKDYLFAANEPVNSAVKGKEYKSTLLVKSSYGGLKYKLPVAPPGMQVAADGTMTWKVPADFSGTDAEVVLSVTDAKGQEILYPFSVRVRDS